MATVQCNSRLIDRTLAKLDRFDSHERRRFDKDFMAALPVMGDTIYEKLVGQEYLDWCSRGPTGMFDTCEQLQIAAIGGRDVSLDLPLSMKVPMPRQQVMFAGRGELSSVFKKVQVNLDEKAPEWEDLVAPSNQLYSRRVARGEEHAEAVRFVKNVLKMWSTLGPALKAWHPLWDLLDPADQARMGGGRPKGQAYGLPGSMQEQAKKVGALVVRIRMSGV